MSLVRIATLLPLFEGTTGSVVGIYRAADTASLGLDLLYMCNFCTCDPLRRDRENASLP